MYIVTIGMDPTELYHHGIKGQHWGVRRYQNYDGTLIKTGSQYMRKTKYTNIDGSLNERGKFHSQKYINKEINKNEKYYAKQIKRYERLKKRCGDDKEMSKKFDDMIKDAKRTKDSVNANIKKFGIDQIMSNEAEIKERALKGAGLIGAGVAIAGLGAGGALVSATVAGSATAGAAKVGEALMKFDPSNIGDKVMNFMDNDPRGQKAYQYLDGGLRAYADARSYVIGTCIDQGMYRMEKMGVIDHASNLASNALSSTANKTYAGLDSNIKNAASQVTANNVNNFVNSVANNAVNAISSNSGTAANAISSNVNPATINAFSSMLGNGGANSINQFASQLDTSQIAALEALYTNPGYAQTFSNMSQTAGSAAAVNYNELYNYRKK